MDGITALPKGHSRTASPREPGEIDVDAVRRRLRVRTLRQLATQPRRVLRLVARRYDVLIAFPGGAYAHLGPLTQEHEIGLLVRSRMFRRRLERSLADAAAGRVVDAAPLLAALEAGPRGQRAPRRSHKG